MQRRILIADSNAATRIMFQNHLGDGLFRTLLSADAAACLQIARRERPDLIVLDCDLPDMAGPEVVAALRADPRTRQVPVIVLVPANAPQKRLQALRAGADDVMDKPADISVLLARLRNLLRQREEAQLLARAWGSDLPEFLGLSEQKDSFQPVGPVGVITSQAETAQAWKDRLAPRLRDQARSYLPAEAASLGYSDPESPPHVFLIEADQANGSSGLRLMTQLASVTPFRHSMFCIIAPEASDAAAMAFDLGAHDVVNPWVCEEELDLRIRLLLRRKQQADAERRSLEAGLRLAIIDPLTGIYNRRYAFPRLAGIAEQAAIARTEFAVLVVDIDRFKSVNDRYGHTTGDTVLIGVVQRLRDRLRVNDLLARIGGEEFLIVLPETSALEAARMAERLRDAVSATPIDGGAGVTLGVTISIGVRTGGGPGRETEDVTAMVAAADGALMRSKISGRNTVTCYSAA
ncbi:diguanylate cyclase [Xinfangfangia sp. D13-10-4-6]|uniref:diguanylate cyclase n=1 Tax=Pseudogemmobacter hezensis TaxID=2737662 RepID=UPI001555A7A9|nr:diguanylate cyclase [Pseudogemmobacter hezensis]NPD13915.1 diguanylate cyclase [Pseudogemmobacter hezensis]